MDHVTVGRYWEENAEVWTRLAREGYDVYRDHLNTPAFPARRNLRDGSGLTYALEIGRYYEQSAGRVDTWLFSAAPHSLRATLRPFRTPRFHRTLSSWLNAVVAAGWTLERVEEPSASDEVVRRCPRLEDTQAAPFFLHVRCRKWA